MDAARVRRKPSYLLHLDIASSLPSVSVGRVRSAFGAAGVKPELVNTLTRLVTVEGQLPQGAPTSVAVGNLALYRLDRRLQGLCDASGAGFAYTRYIDDMAISGGSRLENFGGAVETIVEDCGWGWIEKGGLLGPADRHDLLGLCVGVEVTVDEQYLADLRHALEEAQEHGSLPPSVDAARLRGQIAWVKAVQPEAGGELERMFNELAGEGLP